MIEDRMQRMMIMRVMLFGLLVACVPPVVTAQGARPQSVAPPQGALPSPAPPQRASLPPPRAPTVRPADRFEVPVLPPEVPVTRWQQFCWTGAEALSQEHLSAAGAQGWELVSVTVAATSNVAIPHSSGYGNDTAITSDILYGGQVWVTCFKRPLAAAPPAR
jgi:hypothetical protein